MTTPRIHDDGRNERQRAEQEKVERQRQADRDVRQREYDEEKSRQGGRGGDAERDQADRERADRELQQRREEERGDVPRVFADKHVVDPNFRSVLPEGQIDHPGQLNRDNVNPAIPSADPGKGDIVDPRSLGMESQAGVAPPAVENPPEQWPKRDEKTGQAEQAVDQVQPHVGEGITPDMAAAHMPSINEPAGSNIASGDAGPQELPPLTLTDIDPDRIPVQPEEIAEKEITLTGTGFGPECVVLFDDEEVPTTLVNTTTLKATVPIAPAEGTYDVEVARGEDLSDVLVFEIVPAEAGSGAQSAKREKQKPKPKKSEPPSKRQKKAKGKR